MPDLKVKSRRGPSASGLGPDDSLFRRYRTAVAALPLEGSGRSTGGALGPACQTVTKGYFETFLQALVEAHCLLRTAWSGCQAQE